MKRKIALAMAVSMLITSVPVNSLTGLAEEAVIMEDVVVEEALEEIPELDSSEPAETPESPSDAVVPPAEDTTEDIFVEDIEVVDEEAALEAVGELIADEMTLDSTLELNEEGSETVSDTSGDSAFVPKVDGLEDVDLNKATVMTPANYPEIVSLEAGDRVCYRLEIPEDEPGKYEVVFSTGGEYLESPMAYLNWLFADGFGWTEGAINPTFGEMVDPWGVPYGAGNVSYIVITANETVNLQINITFSPATFSVEEYHDVAWDPSMETTDIAVEVQWAEGVTPTELTYKWSTSTYEETFSNTTNTLTVSKEDIKNGKTAYVCDVTDGTTTRYVWFNFVVDSGLRADQTEYTQEMNYGEQLILAAYPIVNTGYESDLSYEWYEYDKESDTLGLISEANESRYTITCNKSSSYRCKVEDGYDGELWFYYDINVKSLEVENNETVNEIAAVPGGTAALEVSASTCVEDAVISYTWYEKVTDENGDEVKEPVDGVGSNSVLNLTNVQNKGYYICEVTDGVSTETVEFRVSVENNFAVDWGDYSSVIMAAKPDETVTLTAPVTGNDLTDITWKWYKGSVSDETLIDGAESNTLTLSNLTESSFYYFVACDKFGNTVEDSFWVFLDTLTAANEGEMTYVDALPDEEIELTVSATSWYGGDKITYQWQEEVEVDGGWIHQDIPGETSDTLIVTYDGNDKTYRCNISDGTDSANVDFRVVLADTDIELEYNDYYELDYGDDLELSVTPSSIDDNYEYQWSYRLRYEDEFTPIDGATASTYKIVESKYLHEAYYRCEVSNKYTIEPATATITVYTTGIEDALDFDQGFDIKVLQGDTTGTVLEVESDSYVGELNYQWFNEDGLMAGQTSSKLTLPSDLEEGYYEYYCEVYNDQDLDTVWFYVEVAAISLDYDDYHKVLVGEEVELSVTAKSASSTLSYQWYKYNEATGDYDLISGATDSVYKTGALNSFKCKCVVSDGTNSREAEFNVYVDSGFDLVEDENDWNFQGDLGSTVTMEVRAVSDYPEKLTWQWYEYDEDADAGKGNPIEGANSSAYTVKVDSAYKEYVCVVSDSYNTATVYCSVSPTRKLTASAVQVAVEAAAGETVTLKVNAATGAAYGTLKYRWENSDGDTIAENVDTITVTASEETQTYFCRVSDDYDTEKVAFAVGLQGAFDDCAMSFESAVEIKTGETKTAVIPVNGASMYFKFVPEQSGCHYIYSEAEDYDTYVNLYDANRNHLKEDDDGFEDVNFGLKYDFEAGKTYYIRAHFYDDYEKGSYPVTVKYEGGCVDCDWDWDNRVVTKEATCTENGEITCVCTVCGKTNVETIYSEGHAYADEWLVENAATCTKAGTEYRACTVCGEVESRTVEATGHTYSDEITEGDDDETATVIRTYKECTVCCEEETISVTAKESEQAVIDAAETAMSELAASTEEKVNVSTAVTAVTNMDNQTLIDIEEVSEEDAETAMKYVTDLETKLLNSQIEDITGSIGVSVPKASTEAEPTITDNVSVSGAAVTVAKVLMDAEESTDEADKLDENSTYSAQLAVTDKTTEDSEPGVYTVNISLNIIATDAEGATSTFKEDIQPAAPIYITIPVPDAFWNTEFVLKHDTGNGIVEVNYVRNDDNQTISFYAASLSDWMLDVIKCEECSYTVDADQSVEATCQSVGKTVSVCGTCGDVKITMLSKQSHAWGDWTQTKAPSCTEKGSKTHSCTNGDCNETETAEIPKLGHKFSSEYTVDKAATCTADGSKSRHCERCSETYDVQNIPASGSHSWKTVVDKAATCGAAGSQHRECTACQTKETATTIPATGSHNWTNVVDKAATCGTAGSQHKECTVCHSKQAATSIAATGQHTFGAYSVTTAPTVLSTGWEVAKCNKCTATTGRAVAKLEGTIKLSAKSLKLQIKKSVSLTSLVTGLSAGDSIKSWTVDKKGKSYVTLTSKGKVTGKKAGTAKITVTLASGKSAVITLTVQKKAVTTSKVTVANTKIKLNVGKSTTLKPIITPITSFEKATYKTSNKKVATVNSKGKVTAKAPGKATITIKVGKKSVKVTVTVPAPELKSIKLSATAKTLKKGKSFTLKVTLNPKTATNKITYSTSNKKVATVDKKGKVVAKGKGTATITVKAGKITKTCKITVK